MLLSAIIALCTIFLFRNRMLQVRMTVFGSLLLIGFIDIFSWIFIMLPVVVCFYVYDIRNVD